MGDSEGEVLGLENGFDSVGALLSCEAVGLFEGNGNELSMVLAEKKETSGLILTETMDGAWNELLMTDGVGDERQKDLVPLNVELLAIAFPERVENHGG